MIFGKLKTYAIVAGGAVLTVLLIVVKVLTSQNSKLRVKAENAEARIKHAKKVMQADKEIDEQVDSHLADVAKEINETGTSKELDDPNDWEWVDDE